MSARLRNGLIFIVLVTVFYAIRSNPGILTDIRSRSWEAVSADVLDLQRTSKMGHGINDRFDAHALVRYTYRVDGRRYESSMEVPRRDLGAAWELPKPGDSITVFYNRSNPAQSSLTRGLRLTTIMTLSVMALLPFLWLLFYARRR